MAKTKEEIKAYKAAHYAANRESIKVRAASRYAANREAIKAHVKAYAEENRSLISERNKAYREANKEKFAAKSKAYYEAHKEDRIAYQKARDSLRRGEIRAYKKSYVAKNRAFVFAKKLEWQRAHQRAHPEYYREAQARRSAQKLDTQVERIDFMEILKDSKGICGICRKPFDLFGIEFDHIVPLARGGTHTRANIQATHMRCNRVKGAKVG